MKDADYRKTLAAARRDLAKAYDVREDNERRIARLRQTVTTLSQLLGDDVPEAATAKTLTSAVWHCLAAAKTPLTVNQIRAVIEQSGFDIGSSNHGASIHSVLKRLIQRNEISIALKRSHGRSMQLLPRAFWWGKYSKPPNPWVMTTQEKINEQIKRTDARLAKLAKEANKQA